MYLPFHHLPSIPGVLFTGSLLPPLCLISLFLCSLSSAGAGEMAGCLRASIAPAADPRSVPSTHVRQPQPVVTLATGIQCLWPLRAAALVSTYPHTDSHM